MATKAFGGKTPTYTKTTGKDTRDCPADMGTEHHPTHSGMGAAVAKTRGPRGVSGGSNHVKPGGKG